MPSAAVDCWRLSADCSHWAEESRDNAARLAFRQMATAWAGLAFCQDFVLPTDEQAGPTCSESSEAAPVENIASSDVENEQISPIRNLKVDVERHVERRDGRERWSMPRVEIAITEHHPPRHPG
jgi:hypothetical protein